MAVPPEKAGKMFTCRVCKQPKPAEAFTWVKAARYKNGIRRLSECKACAAAARAEWGRKAAGPTRETIRKANRESMRRKRAAARTTPAPPVQD